MVCAYWYNYMGSLGEWRDGSAFKHIYYSWRGLKHGFQHIPAYNSNSMEPDDVFWFWKATSMQVLHRHECRQTITLKTSSKNHRFAHVLYMAVVLTLSNAVSL